MGNYDKTRVVITGVGLVSSIGNNQSEVWESLTSKRSGISKNEEYIKKGLNCHLSGSVKFNTEAIDHKIKRTLGDSGVWAYAAFLEAITDAKLSPEDLSSAKTGIIAGTGAGSLNSFYDGIKVFDEKGLRGMNPFLVNKIMGSSVAANLSTLFKIKGVSYGLSSACATGAHCIGHGADLIKIGKQKIVIAGSSEMEHWTSTIGFDALRILSNTSSRPFDKTRDGIVLSGGAAFVVLEEMESALARGAVIYGELTGYGYNSDGFNLVSPSLEGPLACMEEALSAAGHPVDYINAHATGTLLGDQNELTCIKTIFKDKIPLISSTKGLTGHALGAAGSLELVYSLLMMKNNQAIGCVNISQLDPLAEELGVLTDNHLGEVGAIMSNSFGFGGTNCSLIVKKLKL